MRDLKLAAKDIWRAARQMIELYATDAGLRADNLYEEGDVDGYHAWARITNAIKQLKDGEPTDQDIRN